jgi:sialidase-1
VPHQRSISRPARPGTLAAVLLSLATLLVGAIDIVVRRSTNDGRTWGPIRTVLSGSATDPEAPYTRDNATPVADEETGDVFLVSTGEPATRGTRLPYVQKSTDDGLTFGAPRALTRLSGKTTGWFATGPAHGIQLRNGPYAGRLVVGAYESPGATTQLAGVLYSSDHGETWQTSTTANSYVDGELKPTETAVAELDNGDVYLAARNEQDDTEPHRTHVISTDGGTTVGRHTVANLTTPQIQASVLALRHTYQDTPGDTLVLAAPSGTTGREKLRIRYSTDRGTTWTDARTVRKGHDTGLRPHVTAHAPRTTEGPERHTALRASPSRKLCPRTSCACCRPRTATG